MNIGSDALLVTLAVLSAAGPQRGQPMPKALRPSELVPQGLAVVGAVMQGSSTIITARAVAAAGRCPACGGSTWRVHSRYFRTVLDLPLSGRVVRLVIMARHFPCDVTLCSQQIFTECFGGQILRPWGRRTARVDDLLHHLKLLDRRPSKLAAVALANKMARILWAMMTNETAYRRTPQTV